MAVTDTIIVQISRAALGYALSVMFGMCLMSSPIKAQIESDLFLEMQYSDGVPSFNAGGADVKHVIRGTTITACVRGERDTTRSAVVMTTIRDSRGAVALRGEDPVSYPIRLYDMEHEDGLELRAYRRLVWSNLVDGGELVAERKAGVLTLSVRGKSGGIPSLLIRGTEYLGGIGASYARAVPQLNYADPAPAILAVDWKPVMISDPRIAWATYSDRPQFTHFDRNGDIVLQWFFGRITQVPQTPGLVMNDSLPVSQFKRFTKMTKTRSVIWSMMVPDNESSFRLSFTRANHIILTGNTPDTVYPRTGGRYHGPGKGFGDGLIASLSPDGRLEWATLIGTNQPDGVGFCVEDGAGNLYFDASTYGQDFPTTGPIRRKPNWGSRSDVLIFSLTPDGRDFRWGTYWSSRDTRGEADPFIKGATCTGLVYDNHGGVIATVSQTDPERLPTTPGAWQTVQQGRSEAILTRFMTDGTVDWSTLISTAYDDVVTGIFLERDSTILVRCWIESGGIHQMPAIGVPGQTMTPTGKDGYLLRFNLQGQSTYLWAPFVNGDATFFAPIGDGRIIRNPVGQLPTPDSFNYTPSWFEARNSRLRPEIAILNKDYSSFWVSSMLGAGVSGITYGDGYILVTGGTLSRGAVLTDTLWGTGYGVGYDPDDDILESMAYLVLLNPVLTSVPDPNDSSNTGMMAYPNPTEHGCTIETRDSMRSLEVFDVLGHVLTSMELNGERTVHLNFTPLPTGTYFVRGMTTRGIVSSIVQRR